ncbi:MAG TPA: RsmE family RNA methyltransferase [Phnomibacter sp.]|nr:RsmE family RNA methyltransferase [Phnomibacter sp.]
MEKLPLFFHANGGPGIIVQLDEANARHVVQVLRMGAGEQIQLTNGNGLLWTGKIVATGKHKCEVQIDGEEGAGKPIARRTAIAISPVKNNSRFEWFLEKATEIGISEIYPILCHRTERAHFRHDRLLQICISAMLQSRQVWLPILHEPLSFAQFLRDAGKAYHHRWIAHCEPYEKHLLPKVLQPGMPDSVLLIGPEGDFTQGEIFEATNAGYQPVSLGNTRLRTETAGVVGAAFLCQD